MSEQVEPSKGQKREKLVALLARIRQRAAEPRPAKLHLAVPMPSVHSAVTVPHSYSSSEPESDDATDKVRMVIEPFGTVSPKEAFLPQVSATPSPAAPVAPVAKIVAPEDSGWSEPPPPPPPIEIDTSTEVAASAPVGPAVPAEPATAAPDDHEEPIALTRGRPSSLIPAVAPEAPEPPPPPAQPPAPADELSAESGEFAVAEMPLELEELGPADDLDENESVVEIQVDSPAPPRASPEEDIAARMESESDRAEKSDSRPPESGRELVGAPHESARLRVAGDVARNADANAEPARAREDVQELDSLELEDAPPSFHEPPPRSPRTPSSVKPPSGPPPNIPDELAEPPVSIRPTSEERVVAPPAAPPPTPPLILETAVAEAAIREAAPADDELPPVTVRPSSDRPRPLAPTAEIVHTAVEIAKPNVAVAVQLGPAPEAIERVTVAIDAVVIRPDITPVDVAALLGAVREPAPVTFGALVDAALALGN